MSGLSIDLVREAVRLHPHSTLQAVKWLRYHPEWTGDLVVSKRAVELVQSGADDLHAAEDDQRKREMERKAGAYDALAARHAALREAAQAYRVAAEEMAGAEAELRNADIDTAMAEFYAQAEERHNRAATAYEAARARLLAMLEEGE